MNPKKLHTLLGLLVLLPLLGWVCTGFIFLLKPGYADAYAQISPRYYAIDKEVVIPPRQSWTEVRYLKTILGQHLLVKVDGQWQHLDAENLNIRPKPGEKDEIRLLSDAISGDRERYGFIEDRESGVYRTSTGVELSLNWQTLTISQKGQDTKFIDTLYKIHYLQWLGNPWANKALGVFGLLALSLLMLYGVVLYMKRRSEAG